MNEKKKTIHNPVTGHDYEIRNHSSKYDPNKQFKGLWGTKKKEEVSIEDRLDKIERKLNKQIDDAIGGKTK